VKLKIAIVSAFYSEGMGYTENCLPKFLARLGHDVHVVTSIYNVYGNQDDYPSTYQSFLGPATQPATQFQSNGYSVHRLATRLVNGYIWLPSLRRVIADLRPDVVHSLEHGSLLTFYLALLKLFYRFSLFTESHQHLSVVKPHLLKSGMSVGKLGYWLTRTLPGRLASLAVEKCFAIAPDCADVAVKYFGVPARKVSMQSLGSDTALFRPPTAEADHLAREDLRNVLECTPDDVLCVYTGRFTATKNPALLATAIDMLRQKSFPVRGLFVGEGPQRGEIEAKQNCKILPFMRHAELAEVYRAADIAIWPREESMSMLDAASAGLPLVASDRLGESKRVTGSGLFYQENDAASLADVLQTLLDPDLRRRLGEAGAQKMRQTHNWAEVANSVSRAYARSRGWAEGTSGA
jgi:glycosyltransferase involved in cell wall biosynthesis